MKLAMKVDGKKFMWDGREYPDAQAAEAARTEYEKQEFETTLLEEEGKFLVYTRRLVKEIVVDGPA